MGQPAALHGQRYRTHGTAPPRLRPADNEGTLWVVSAELEATVCMQVRDEHGNAFTLTGPLAVFVPFARQVLVLQDTNYPEVD